MEEVVEKYLENEKIVGDQVLLILYWHVFVKYWMVVKTPIHLRLEMVIALQFFVAYYQMFVFSFEQPLYVQVHLKNVPFKIRFTREGCVFLKNQANF